MSETTRTYKPCPFCGNTPYVNRHDIVNCTNDECIMSVVNVELKEWNTRSDGSEVDYKYKLLSETLWGILMMDEHEAYDNVNWKYYHSIFKDGELVI